MDAIQVKKITDRMKALYSLDKTSLKARVRQSYQVCDLNGACKDSLVSMVLMAEYGEKKLAAWNAAR